MTKVLLKVNNKVMATDGKLVTSEKGTLLKPLLDATKSARYLFKDYQGESVEGLIQYNDTENVEKFDGMVSFCENIIKIQPINTSKGFNFNGMFRNNKKLLKIDISVFYSYGPSFSGYFCYNSYSLKAVIIRSFGRIYVLNSNSFTDCYHMLGTTDKTYNPEGLHDGYVYVPRDMIDILSAETNWSALQFRALEDYTDDGTTTGKFLDEKAGL